MGRNMNLLKKFSRASKAGDSHMQGFKPKVRGVAMNPVDHPNGGRTKTNQPEKSV
jgi:large subunit ribosomal protein L2